MFSKDFLLSFLVTILGVFLLFGIALAVEYKQNPNDFYNPLSKNKIVFENYESKHPVIPLLKKDIKNKPNLSAPSILVIDDYSQAMLFEKESTKINSIASITKLMSAIIILELPRNWEEVILIEKSDAYPNGSSHIKVGESYSASDLWNIGLVGSSNKAINALVRTSGVTKEGFVSLMNKKAEKLGLDSLYFTEPTGLDEKNVGNSQDIARLLREALKYKKIRETLNLKNYDLGHKNIWNTSWLKTFWISHNFSSNVGKTGYINMSGYNFVVELEKRNHKIIVVILGANTNEKRFEEARDLGEWVFENFVWPGEEGYSLLIKN